MISEVLARYSVDLSEADLAALIAEVFEAQGGPDATAMTASDAEWLAEHSGVTVAVGKKDQQLDRLRVEVEAVASSVPAAALADRWGVDPSRVRHRASEGRLYSFRAGRTLRFPQWQFGLDGRPLPGLAQVLGALPQNLHPAEVEGFFAAANPNLVLGEEPVSPVDWLVSGGNPDVVAGLARDLDRW